MGLRQMGHAGFHVRQIVKNSLRQPALRVATLFAVLELSLLSGFLVADYAQELQARDGAQEEGTAERATVVEVMKRYDEQKKAYLQRRRALPREERPILQAKLLPPIAEAEAIVRWCEQNSDDEICLPALRFVLEYSAFQPVADRAVKVILHDHLEIKGEGFRQLVMVLQAAPPEVADKCLAELAEKATDRHTRGTGCWALGLYNAQLLSWAQQLDVPTLASRVPRNLIPVLKELDPGATLARSERMLKRARDEFGDLEIQLGPARKITLARMATRDLARVANEFKTLTIGKPAPMITGRNLDGESMTLESHRGRIVMLSFWSTSCVPCLRMIPHEQRLLDQFGKDGFVLLGINVDPERDKAIAAVTKFKVNWPNWWDDPASQSTISSQYNVSFLPTIYLVDHRGIIRHKHLRGEELEKAIADLLARMRDDVR